MMKKSGNTIQSWIESESVRAEADINLTTILAESVEIDPTETSP
jgi:hypothetical protein